MFLLKPHALSLYGRSHCWFPTPVLRFSPHTEHSALKSLWRPLRRYVHLWCSLNSCGAVFRVLSSKALAELFKPSSLLYEV